MTPAAARVFEHLKRNGSIQPLEALSEYGIYRLADAVYRIRQDGHQIETRMIDGKNRNGEPVRWAEYRYHIS